jgi:geranylgeranyl reductase family protein
LGEEGEVGPTSFDAVVVGAGPAGSVAALVLARSGARVGLVDKAGFPRDKACGDLVGPRGVQVLEDLGLDPPGQRVGDMEVVGPSGRRVLLRAFPGLTYPGHGLSVPRLHFDAWLRHAALEAGAVALTGRAGAPRFGEDGQLTGFRVERPASDGVEVRGDVVIGADGALSRVGEVAGLVDPGRALWGFAVRAYVPAPRALPRIWFWEPAAWEGYPGYGWLFPGRDGAANIGLGVGVRGRRSGVARVTADLERFSADLARAGHVRMPPGRAPAPRMGGWLKMGMVGTIAARGRTMLVGDAAGLVNPLQGEGIAQAMGSARAAAQAVLDAGPGGAAARYRAALARQHGHYAATTAPITTAMLANPRLVAAAGRLLTAPGIGRLVAGGWSVYWNDLLDGAAPGRPRRTAAMADLVADAITWASRDRRSVTGSLDGEAAVSAGWRSPGPRSRGPS